MSCPGESILFHFVFAITSRIQIVCISSERTPRATLPQGRSPLVESINSSSWYMGHEICLTNHYVAAPGTKGSAVALAGTLPPQQQLFQFPLWLVHGCPSNIVHAQERLMLAASHPRQRGRCSPMILPRAPPMLPPTATTPLPAVKECQGLLVGVGYWRGPTPLP